MTQWIGGLNRKIETVKKDNVEILELKTTTTKWKM